MIQVRSGLWDGQLTSCPNKDGNRLFVVFKS